MSLVNHWYIMNYKESDVVTVIFANNFLKPNFCQGLTNSPQVLRISPSREHPLWPLPKKRLRYFFGENLCQYPFFFVILHRKSPMGL